MSRQHTSLFAIRTASGIVFVVEASSTHQARLRAQDPRIWGAVSRMLQQALSQVVAVEPIRGPRHTLKKLIFNEDFFNQ